MGQEWPPCAARAIDNIKQMATVPALDLVRLLKNIPEGDWVAISTKRDRVVSHGPDMSQVLDEADAAGETDTLLVRVPTFETAAILRRA